MKPKYSKGFTLLELMIALAIIGILAAIAYPAYQDQIIKSRRSDGQAALTQVAALMESYYTENNTYAGATMATLGLTSSNSPQGFYTIAITTANATTFLLTATPAGAQTNDTTCGALTLDNVNNQNPTPSICWQ